MKTRLIDIANAAGVSTATVSNALNGNNRVSEATRLKVLELSRKMGYHEPMEVSNAKGIRFVSLQRHGKIIIDSPFFSELLSGIEHACRKNGCELTVSQFGINETTEIDKLIKDASRPIILLATEIHREEMRQFLKFRGKLIVLDNYFLNSNSFHTVCTDNQKGGYLAGEYFITHGHTHLGMITSNIQCNNVRDRRVGFQLALQRYRYSMKEEDIFPIDPTIDGSFEDMCRILDGRKGQMPSALFAHSDMVAIGAMRALNSRGYSIPDQISVIGMDNLPACQLISPQLTTIDVPKYAMGYAAVERLIDLSGQDPNTAQVIMKTVINVRLIERESVLQKPVLPIIKELLLGIDP